MFAPCTRTLAPCPMLANPDDWCHEDREVALPPRTAELARLTHLRDSGLKFSLPRAAQDSKPLIEQRRCVARRQRAVHRKGQARGVSAAATRAACRCGCSSAIAPRPIGCSSALERGDVIVDRRSARRGSRRDRPGGSVRAPRTRGSLAIALDAAGIGRADVLGGDGVGVGVNRLLGAAASRAPWRSRPARRWSDWTVGASASTSPWALALALAHLLRVV